VAAAAPAPRVVPHNKWMETVIGFDASEFPKNMVRAEKLPLVISPTITKVRLYHILIDGGAALNLISLAAFQKLQIPMSRLSRSCPFMGVGPGSFIPHGSISLPVMFGTPNNYRTESVVFDVMKVNLPFNAIIGRPALYQFMAIAHYAYLVLKMPLTNGLIKIHGDCSADLFTLEKLQALAAAQEAAAGYGEPDKTPLSSRQCILPSAPRMQLSDSKDVPVKTVHIDVDATQSTRIAGNLGDK
jgi:hypothetical protein